MNKYQRAVLIGVGLIIAIIQLYGIGEHGLDDSRGWAISFLISAVLLFIGFGSWQGFGAFFNKKVIGQNDRPTEAPVATPPSQRNTPVQPQHNKPDKYEYGIHISELDIAIEAHKNYAQKTNLFAPLQGNGRSLNWNCCASVYASMRYAARKTEMRVHNMVWNTIIRAIVVRMSTEEIEGVGMGDPEYKTLEESAYTDIERINKVVEDAVAGKGGYEIEPIVKVLAIMFGSRGEAIKALSAMVLMNAEKAQKKILPELLADLS